MFLSNDGIDKFMEEIVVTGRRENYPSFDSYTRDALLSGSSGDASVNRGDSADLEVLRSVLDERQLQEHMLNLPEPDPVRYQGQTRDELMQDIKNFAAKTGKTVYDTAAATSKGIAKIPIAGIAYQKAVAGANPGAFLAGKTFAPNVMSDFGFAKGGEAKSFPDLNNDGEVTYADILKGRGVEMNEGGSVRDPYYNPYFGRANPEEVDRIMKENPGISLQDAISIALGIDTADKTTRQGYANGGQVRRRVPDVYFDQYNMGGQVSKTPMQTPSPMMQDPRFYNAPPNPMGPLVGGIGNLIKNQQKTNRLLGGSNQNNNSMNNNLKISYNPNPTSKEQRRVFSNVLESTRPIV